MESWLTNRFLPMAFSVYYSDEDNGLLPPPPSSDSYVQSQNNSINYVTPSGLYYVRGE